MSYTFIQVHQSLVTHRKTLRLARLLNLDRYAVIGRLVALWTWCLDNTPGGRLGVLGDDIDAETLAEVMGWSAEMGTPDELLDSLILVGFLDMDEVDQCLHIHHWQTWEGPTDRADVSETPAQAGLLIERTREHARERRQRGGAL
jgi:hypothetical protein